MGQALYRKHRPKGLGEVVGQEQITTTLLHALKTGKIAHAYLFTGPRGVGKTSIARILAHEINDLPYTDDSMHLDIIEIDAASNRRIDEIRDLRDKVHIAPSSAKYKVYIIDEVHMLTREAFNALLKTLEEPPAHVVFILATTEVHKLPETIISRTQRFTFKPYPLEQVVAHLKNLAAQEDITIDDEALKLIAAYGEGSFRDSISLLDQTRGHNGKVDAAYIRTLIGLPSDEAVEALLVAAREKNGALIVTTLNDLQNQGFEATRIAKVLGEHIRNEIVQGSTSPSFFELLEKLLDVPTAHEPTTFLEIVLLEYALKDTALATQQPTHTIAPVQQVVAQETALKPVAKKVEAPKPDAKKAEPEPKKKEPAAQSLKVGASVLTESSWAQVLAVLKTKYNTLYSIARMARPVFSSEGVTLYLKFAFHKKRLSEAKNQQILSDIIEEIIGQQVAVRCEVDAESTSTPPANTPIVEQPTPSDSDPVASISNIFGGAELLES